MVLAAIIVLLIGVCVWGVFGKMDTTVSTVAVVNNGNAVCYVKADAIDSIKVGHTVRLQNAEYMVEAVSSYPISVSGDMDAYAMHLGSLTIGEWVYEVKLNTDIADGT